jgi:hypothetical protein
VRLAETEPQREFAALRVPVGIGLVVGRIPEPCLHLRGGELTGLQEDHRASLGIVKTEDRPVAERPQHRGDQRPGGFGDLAALWRQVPARRDETRRAMPDVFVGDGVVVEIDA